MQVLCQSNLQSVEKPKGIKRDLRMFWQFLWDVPEGTAKKTEKKVLWRGKAWI